MGRVLLAIVLMGVLLVQSPVAEAMDWTRIVQMLRGSTVPLACSLHQQHVCTAFSINQEEGLYLTAFHCTPKFVSAPDETGHVNEEEPLLDGKPLAIVFANEEVDIAIVRGVKHRPALLPRTKTLEVGTEVGSYGYGYGLEAPIFRTGVISVFLKGPDNIERYLVDNAFIMGMSGGPVVDRDGRVVGVNHKTDNWSGFSASIRQILTSSQFWGSR